MCNNKNDEIIFTMRSTNLLIHDNQCHKINYFFIKIKNDEVFADRYIYVYFLNLFFFIIENINETLLI